jgi:UDP-glucose 4-epimerase
MRCLVTGAAGFIGSHLVDQLLKDNYKVVGIDNLSVGRRSNLDDAIKDPNFTFIVKDICEVKPEDFEAFDWVFHLAARADIVPSITDPREYHRSNVDGTFNILECARAWRTKKFIYAASSSCYGDNPKTPTPEDHPIVCKYPYALTKMLGEQYVLHYAAVYGLNCLSLRLFNVYGPRARTSGTYGAVFGVFLAQIANDKPCTVVGNGRQSRDFTFVSDVVRAFVMGAKLESKEKVLNISASCPIEINKIVQLLGNGDIAYLPRRPGEPFVTHGMIYRARSSLCWRPYVSIEEGCKIMRALIPSFKDAPLWTPEMILQVTRDWFEHVK